MEMKFERLRFGTRLKRMLSVDLRRMFTMPLLCIMVGSSFVIPILILVMTTMMDGSVSVDPTTGAQTVIRGFDSTWQAIGTLSGQGAAMSMDLTGMCNINLIYFFAAVFVCLFVTEDFRSGYAKNLFAVRAKKGDYVISKTLTGIIGGVLMLLAFFAGTMIGGAVAGLPFDAGHAGAGGIARCMLAKMALMAVFVPLALLWSAAARQKTAVSLVGALMTGMLFFMLVPMLTPLDSTAVNVLGCLAGGALFSVGLGAVSTKVLGRVSLV